MATKVTKAAEDEQEHDRLPNQLENFKRQLYPCA